MTRSNNSEMKDNYNNDLVFPEVKHRVNNVAYSAILHSFIKLGGTHDILINGIKIRFLNEIDSIKTFRDGEIQIVHCEQLFKNRSIDSLITQINNSSEKTSNSINGKWPENDMKCFNCKYPYNTRMEKSKVVVNKKKKLSDNDDYECRCSEKFNKWKQNGCESTEAQSYNCGNQFRCYKRTFTWGKNNQVKLWEYNYSTGLYISSFVIRHFLEDTKVTGNGHNYTTGKIQVAIQYRGKMNGIDKTLKIININNNSFVDEIDDIQMKIISNYQLHKIIVPEFYSLFFYNQDYMNVSENKKTRIRTTEPEIIVPKCLASHVSNEINFNNANFRYDNIYQLIIIFILHNKKIKINQNNNNLNLLYYNHSYQNNNIYEDYYLDEYNKNNYDENFNNQEGATYNDNEINDSDKSEHNNNINDCNNNPINLSKYNEDLSNSSENINFNNDNDKYNNNNNSPQFNYNLNINNNHDINNYKSDINKFNNNYESNNNIFSNISINNSQSKINSNLKFPSFMKYYSALIDQLHFEIPSSIKYNQPEDEDPLKKPMKRLRLTSSK